MDQLLDDLLDVSRIIRDQLRLSPRVVSVAEVAAVSSCGDGGTRGERGSAAGIDRHLAKPVSRRTLTALLFEAQGPAGGADPARTRPEHQLLERDARQRTASEAQCHDNGPTAPR
jgi:hypothetical protein